MKKILIVIPLLFLLGSTTVAQPAKNQSKTPLQQMIASQSFDDVDHVVDLFQQKEATVKEGFEKQVSYYEIFELQNEQHQEILAKMPLLLKVSITFQGQERTLLLKQHEVFSDSYVLKNERGEVMTPASNGLFYRGTLEGDERTLATASIFQNEVRMSFSDDITNYRITKLAGGDYIAYRDIDLLNQPGFSCRVLDPPISKKLQEEEGMVKNPEEFDLVDNCQYVEIFFECDYEFYKDEGYSINSVEQQVAAIFNEVQTLYFNEYIPIIISDVLVWTTSDPYIPFGDTEGVLNKFIEFRGSNYEGRLPHLLSTRYLGGGQASGIGLLCSNDEPHSVSGGIDPDTIPLFPSFSWSVQVVTHELGHIFGSPHTHGCYWSGGKIDDCGNVYAITNNEDDDDDGTTDELDEAEGSGCFNPSAPVIPSSGGTIMSYCHLTSNGINFNSGFGSQPGDKIRNAYATSSCYSTCNTWVDYDWGGNENGSFNLPWDTLIEAVNSVSNGGTIYIKSSIGNETPTIDVDKSFIIRTWEGPSTVGQ